jgi:predicted nucleic acid-binding Zn ribbon protein
METLKDAVHSVMQDLLAGERRVSKDNPQELLRRALTKQEARHIKFNYFKNGILNISVDSSSWLYNLNLQKEELLARLNKGLLTVKEIRFRIGEVEWEKQKLKKNR